MKLLNLLFLAVLVSTFLSCTKENDELIIGTWSVNDISFTSQASSEYAGNTTTSSTTATGSDYNATLTFKNDGTYTSEGTFKLQATTTTSDSTYTSEQTVADFLGTGTWSIEGDNLTTTDNSGGDPTTVKIEKLNSSKLNISVTDHSEQTQSGVTTIQDTNGTYMLEK